MKIDHKPSSLRIFNLIILTTTLFFVSTISYSKNIKENSLEKKSEVKKKIERKKKFILTSYQYETTAIQEESSNPTDVIGKKYVFKSNSTNNSIDNFTKNSTKNNSSAPSLKKPEPISTKNNAINNETDSKLVTGSFEQDQKIEIIPQSKAIKEKKKEIINPISKYQTRADLIYKYSSNRKLGRVELFLPFYQTTKSLVFTDIRYWLDNNSNNEGNLGLGYRQIFDDEYILGGYGFYDRRKSEYNNVFNQATIGAELLTLNYDLRTNLYSPIGTTEKSIGSASSSYSNNYVLNGYNVVYTKQTSISSEYALKGYDIEVGRKLPLFEDFRVFLAKYRFSNYETNVDGYRYRGLYNFLESEKSKLYLEGEHSNDNSRGNISYFGFRYSYNFGSTAKNKLTALEKRMTNQVIRDIDIVTQSKYSITTSIEKLQGADGNDQKIIYVNNSVATSGDGTLEKPYKTLAEAQNNSSAYNIIYVYRGDGTDFGYNQGIVLKDYQKIYGQNIDFTLGDIINNSTDNGTVFISRDNYSVLSNTTGPVINVANNNVIRGLDISSTGQIGINYNDKQGGIIKDNYIHNNATGISIITTINNNNIIGNNTISNNLTSLSIIYK